MGWRTHARTRTSSSRATRRVTFPMDAHGHARYASALINAQQTREKAYIVSGFSGDFFEERIGSIVRSGHRTYRGRVATTAASLALSAAVTLTLGTVGTASGNRRRGRHRRDTPSRPMAGRRPAGRHCPRRGRHRWPAGLDRSRRGHERYDFWVRPFDRRIDAPRYTVLVPETLIAPENIEVNFSPYGGAPAPNGMTDLMSITDTSTGVTEFYVYCYPRDPNFPQYNGSR